MKKVLLLTFIVAFLFGCSAEGIFSDPGNPIEGNRPSIDWDENAIPGNDPIDGYCLMSGSCYDMSYYGITSSVCRNTYGGTVYSTQSACEAANSTVSSDGYCLMSGSCYDMSYYGITSSVCRNTYGGTVYSTQSACEAANNTVSSDNYCLLDYYCYNMNSYGITSSTCNSYGGTVYSSEASCNANVSVPAGYSYCYTDYDHDCWLTDQEGCDYYGGTMVGSTSASCPAGSY